MTTTATQHPQTWRAQARKAALWSTLAALGLVLAAGVVVWSWRDSLPDPVASHWGATGTPDRFMSIAALLAAAVLLALVCAALFGAIALWWGQTALTRRLAAAATVWIGALSAALLVTTTAAQRGLDDASASALPGAALAVSIVVSLALGAVAAFLVPGDAPAPAASTPIPADAARLDLADGERAVWLVRVGGGTGLVIGAAAIVMTAVLAVALQAWAMLMVPVLLTGLFAAMFAFTVRVDSTGLSVRSVVGWPGSHVPADEVLRASVTRVDRPLVEYGGYGWRTGRGGRVGVVLRRGEALLVERTGERSFLVTVDDAARGAALLNTVAERART
jgi:hypothetical protein